MKSLPFSKKGITMETELQKKYMAIFLKAIETYKKNRNNDILRFFIENYETMKRQKTSMFGFRVECMNTKVKKRTNKNDIRIHIKTDIVNEKKECIISDMQLDFVLDKKYDLNYIRIKQFLIIVITLGLNGYLTSYIERIDFKNELSVFINEPTESDEFCCSDCQQQFTSAKRFIQHIKSKKHEKQLLEQFGIW